MILKKGFEKYECSICKEIFAIEKVGIVRRKIRPGEPICQKCYKEISKWSRNATYYPNELQLILKEEVWDYNLVKSFLEKISGSKKKVKFICKQCGKKEVMRIDRMARRKICGFQQICKKCSLKFAVSSEECRESNSKAQYIAQNRPEVLEKQRLSQLKLMKKDPLYAEKRCSKSFISGKIKGFRFDSSWELYFIVCCWESKDIESISRYDGSIEYFDCGGKKRKYYPDFVVCYKNGNEKIIEIKGSKKYNNFHEKFNAARIKHGINYIVLEEKDLLSMGIKFKTESYLKSFYKKNYSDITFFNNDKTNKIKERIEKWLK